MKKLFTISINCIIVCMLFSSCASNLSIVKRHYRPGYYIDYRHRAPSVEYAAQKTAPVQKIAVAPLAERTLPALPTPEGAFNPDMNRSSGLIAVPAEEKTTYKRPVFNIKQALLNPVSIAKTETSSLQSRSSLYQGAAAYDDDRAAGAALSLLWIVIVVILILWLIGILSGDFGLGGLINLLLVIALILLILWLLRII